MALDIGFSKTKTSKADLLQITCFFGGKTVSTWLEFLTFQTNLKQETKMTTLTFDVSESLAQELQHFAQAKQKPLNALLIDVIQTYLNAEEDDDDDLAIVKERENDAVVSHEAVIARLKADGIL